MYLNQWRMTYLNSLKNTQWGHASHREGLSPFSFFLYDMFSFKVRCTYLLPLFKKLEGWHAFDFTLCSNILREGVQEERMRTRLWMLSFDRSNPNQHLFPVTYPHLSIRTFFFFLHMKINIRTITAAQKPIWLYSQLQFLTCLLLYEAHPQAACCQHQILYIQWLNKLGNQFYLSYFKYHKGAIKNSAVTAFRILILTIPQN